MGSLQVTLSKNRTRIITLAVLAVLFLLAIQGMETKNWAITVLRGLSVGAVVFLVAAGFSLIFGLMDVLNLAHGEMFMIGAYIGWTVYVRPDTFVDILTPVSLLAVGFVLMPVWRVMLARWRLPAQAARVWPWFGLIISGVLLISTVGRYPITKWNPEVFTETPVNYAVSLSQNKLVLPEPLAFEAISPLAAVLGILLSGILLAVTFVGFSQRKQTGIVSSYIPKRTIVYAVILLALGLGTLAANDALTAALISMGTTWRFFLAMLTAGLSGLILGGMVEITMIRPLYDRPIYQIMLTLGVGFIIIEVVRSVWGRPEFTMPKPEIFNGSGDGCPATSFGDWLAHHCSTFLLFGGRVRTYNEVFIILVGLIVLISIWLLLKRTRMGMVIRAGVQDAEMVEALGINVRQVFSQVFALGVGLAALGGVLAAPSFGLSDGMGGRLLLLALIALAIGGLTSFPGAAAGAVLVGLLQQFIIRYGQIGINIPFLEEPFKPSPPLVPASTILLMVIILLVLPQGLFGRNE